MAGDDHHHHTDEIEQLKEVEHKESLMEKLSEKLHGHDSSNDSDKDEKKKDEEESVKAKIFRLFGREKPVHKVFGGGKPADIFLWRNKKVSGGVVGGATAVYVLFELIGYHLLTLLSHGLIFGLAVLFLWSNVSHFINKSPPTIPKVTIPEDTVKEFANAFRYEINHGLSILRDIASGNDLKRFLVVIAGLWLLSFLGSCCNFLTLFYIFFVLLFTVPVLYENYDDKVDAYADKAFHEIKKLYAVFDAKVLSKIPMGPLKDKKKA